MGPALRGDAAATSDWDFAYLADRAFDQASFLGVIVRALSTENVDLVDLRTASGLLRFRVAREGRLVWGEEDLMHRFRLEAATFWGDTEPVLRSAYDAVLARL